MRLPLLLLTALPAAVLCAAPVLTLETNEHGATIRVDGQPFATYVTDGPGATKPYLWDLYGPGQVLLTRAFPVREVPGEQRDHPHHRGIFFGHDDTSGFDTWAEPACFPKALAGKPDPEGQERLKRLGRIRHRGFEKKETAANTVTLTALADHLDAAGSKRLEERRTMVFSVAANGDRIIDVDLELTASAGPVTFGDKKDGGIGIRLPSALAVDSKKGGRLVSSEGLADKAVWGTRAKWCDYHGPLGEGTVGVAILNHPGSFRFPTPWHARTYGLFAANPFGTKSLNAKEPDGAHTLSQGATLKLFHRFILHRGDEKTAGIEQAWQAYAKQPKG